jgi:hypothetical protein
MPIKKGDRIAYGMGETGRVNRIYFAAGFLMCSVRNEQTQEMDVIRVKGIIKIMGEVTA